MIQNCLDEEVVIDKMWASQFLHSDKESGASPRLEV